MSQSRLPTIATVVSREPTPVIKIRQGTGCTSKWPQNFYLSSLLQVFQTLADHSLRHTKPFGDLTRTHRGTLLQEIADPRLPMFRLQMAATFLGFLDHGQCSLRDILGEKRWRPLAGATLRKPRLELGNQVNLQTLIIVRRLTIGNFLCVDEI